MEPNQPDIPEDIAVDFPLARQQDITKQIEDLAKTYANALDKQTRARITEMESDDKSHYLIYRVLRVSKQEGHLIDAYQNKGRFLYKYAGSFLEAASILCFLHGRTNVVPKQKVKNTLSTRPKEFEIDCLIGNDAIELKWRDATTDGDHITKEHARVKVIQAAGYKPIRVMFYYPNREQAIRIQETLKTLYNGVGGEYYVGDDAWNYVQNSTGVNLKAILTTIAAKNVEQAEKNALISGKGAIEAEKNIKKLTEEQ